MNNISFNKTVLIMKGLFRKNQKKNKKRKKNKKEKNHKNNS